MIYLLLPLLVLRLVVFEPLLLLVFVPQHLLHLLR